MGSLHLLCLPATLEPNGPTCAKLHLHPLPRRVIESGQSNKALNDTRPTRLRQVRNRLHYVVKYLKTLRHTVPRPVPACNLPSQTIYITLITFHSHPQSQARYIFIGTRAHAHLQSSAEI